MRKQVNIGEKCKATQELIVESDTNLDKLAQALKVADTARKKLMVQVLDLNLQIREIINYLEMKQIIDKGIFMFSLAVIFPGLSHEPYPQHNLPW